MCIYLCAHACMAALSSSRSTLTTTTPKLQAKPIVRVAVEAVRQGDLDALERGLAKLYQADPAVEISVQESGEHVITALGELHLEQCIKVGKRHRDKKRAGQRRVAGPTKQSIISH